MTLKVIICCNGGGSVSSFMMVMVIVILFYGAVVVTYGFCLYCTYATPTDEFAAWLGRPKPAAPSPLRPMGDPEDRSIRLDDTIRLSVAVVTAASPLTSNLFCRAAVFSNESRMMLRLAFPTPAETKLDSDPTADCAAPSVRIVGSPEFAAPVMRLLI